MRLCDMLDRGAELYPNHPCLSDGTTDWSYAEVRRLSHKVGLALLSSGLQNGDKVAVYSPNHALAYAAIMGASRIGGAWVLLNARNAVDEIIYVLNNTKTDCLFYHSSLSENVARIRQEVPDLRLTICIDQADDGASFVEDWIKPFEGEVPDETPVDSRAVSLMASSGGTTGTPKGIELSHRAVEAATASFLSVMPTGENPVHLMVAPMTHAAGFTSFPMLLVGGKNIFMTDTAPEAIMGMIESHKVTHLFLPPTLIYVMLAHPKVRSYDYSSLKNFIYAAAPMSADKLQEAIEVFGPVMTQTYGQAEAPMICTYLSPVQHAEALETGNGHRLLSCGRPTPYTRVAIMDDDGNLLDRNDSGEIVVRGDIVMNSYLNNPEANAEASAYGWHHTGDVGYIDSDGYVYIVDRKKDMIITGGFNVFPSEIEQVIWTHPGVQDCAVIGVPDEKWGEAVTAIIEPKPGATVDTEAVITLCKEKLGSVKAPKAVHIRDQLPRSAVGKVLKKDIRAEFWRGRDRAVG